MPEPVYAPNHTVDQATGFLESNAWLDAFNAPKKQTFLALLKENGLKFWRTCAELGVKGDTVHKHLAIDPAFKDAYEQVKTEFYDELEGISRINALNPKSVIERIFQLKAAFPSKYGDNKQAAPSQITINIDGEMIRQASERARIVEAEIITESMTLSAKDEQVDSPTQSTTHTHSANT